MIEAQPMLVEVSVVLPSGVSYMVASVSSSEPISSISPLLQEFSATCKYTNYKFSLPDNTTVSINESMEIGNYVTPPTDEEQHECKEPPKDDNTDLFAQKLTLVLVPLLYDMKKCRAQLSRVRENISSPPSRQFTSSSGSSSSNGNNETGSAESKGLETSKAILTVFPLPQEDEIFSHTSLDKFYRETLLRIGSPSNNGLVKLPADCIKSVSISGWNPPPPYRCAAGDLLYFEVVTSDEGTFHVTGTTNGFYVNRSTRNHFDPSPTTNAHFSHELLDTILGLSASCRAAWKALCSQVHEDVVIGKSGALDGIANLYCNGRDTDPSLKLQWNVPITENFSTEPNTSSVIGAGAALSGTGSIKDRFVHGYDMSRAHDALTDLFGADDVGVLREWNDEIQTTRALATKDISDKVLQAQYISKIYTEFNEAVKAGVIAISEGSIVPINPLDDENNRVYIYNNIFYSRAVDSKDNFRICGGVEASRKMAGHDLRNQRLIQAAGIDGLCTVLHCVVDYKGDRLIGQTVVPGVLQGGQHPARLMYGALEMGKRMSVKNETLKLMQALFSRFYIPTRTITAQLQFKPAESLETLTAETLSSNGPVGSSAREVLTPDAVEEDLSNIGVKTDEVDEAVPMTSTTLPHIGCLETKVLHGSDGRLYTLEALRLTPRDANYVKGDKGTKHISSEMLSHIDDGVATTYVLRLELVENYVHTKVKSLQMELAQELVRQRQLHEKEKEEKQKLLAATAGNEGDKEEVKKSEAEEEQERREKIQVQKDFSARVDAITPASLHLELNPNVFIEGFDCDVDPTIVQKDEDTARLLSDFLFKVVGDIVEQARVGVFCPGDNATLVDGLHGSGVNMRYLGHIADLSYAQELEDAALLKTNHQRLQSMPTYWLELVEVEILARCFKHILAARFRAYPEVKLCPAPTIATLLNHLFGSSPSTSEDRKERSESVISNGAEDNTTASEAAAAGQNGGTTPSRKKKKKKGSDHHQDEFSMTQSTTVPDMPNVAGTPEDMFKEIQSLALRKFALKEFSLIGFDRTTKKKNVIPLGNGQIDDDHNDVSASTENKDGSSSVANGHIHESGTPSCIVINDRVSRCMLLRRICEVCGVRVASRDYHFPPSGGSTTGALLVFEAKDIWGCIPLMKSCEQSVPLTECRSLLSNAKTFMERGQISLAFDMLSETSQYQQQITGPVHKEYLMITSVMTKLLVDAGDAQAALAQCAKSLSLAVQLFGLDSPDAGLFHQQMASILAEMLDRPAAALQHLLAARYIAELTGGPNHPDVGALYLRIAGVLGQINRLSNDDDDDDNNNNNNNSTEKTKESDVNGTNSTKQENNSNNFNKASMEIETTRRREIILRCLAVAKSKTYDVEQSAVITKNVAELLAQMGHYNSALAEQRTVLKTFDQLYDSPDDERRKDAKARVEKYLRLNTIEKVAAAKEIQRMQSQLIAEQSPTISNVHGSATVISTKDNNTNINGNSNGHTEKEGGSPGKKKKSK